MAGTGLESSPLPHPGRAVRGAVLATVGVAVVSAGLCAGAVLVVIAVVTVVAMFRPDPDVEGLGVRNPLGIGPAHVGNGWHLLLLGPVLALALGAAPVALVALIARQRRAVGRVRSQLQWLLLGFVSCLAIVVVTTVVPSPWGRGGHYGLAVAFAMVPLAIAVAVLRHGLFDVELVVNRAIVYAALTALGLAAYAGLLALIGTGTGRGTYAPLLAALIAAVLTAARSGFQRFVDRKLFGSRRDPYEVVRRVGVSVAAADNPGTALAGLVSTVCEVLALPYAAVEPAGPAGDVGRAESGSPVPWTEALPAVYRGRQVGVLRVGHRHRGERFRPEEASALGDVAHRAATLLHAAGLSADLQASRERVVVAREEERRRLRRDLHDGLGPELAGMALQLDSLASGLRGQAALAERAFGLRDRMRHTVTEVRRIVEGLRPSAVDELGLAEALRQLVARHPDVAVLVLTMSEDDDSLFAALRAGARGYLLKESAADDIVRAVVTVARGGTVLGARVSTRVLDAVLTRPLTDAPRPFPRLTDREREVLDLVARGYPNARVAHHLGMSEKTVRNHVSVILAKLPAATRAEAVALARDNGLGLP